MIENPYQMVSELRCDELGFLKKDPSKEHLKDEMISYMIYKKCNF